MGFIEDTLRPVPLPKILKAEQEFDRSEIEDLPACIRGQLEQLSGFQGIQEGQRIAVTAGSRAIDRIDIVLRCVVDLLKQKGAKPFLVPAMGSHGGATAEGQLNYLRTLNITEESMGAPILSSMEVDLIGTIADGRPVYFDHYANQADGVVLVNRIKAHTSFKGPYESGLLKMMAIGLGKQKGAQNYHKTGFREMPRIIQEVGKEVLRRKPILFGIGLIENGYGRLTKIAALNPEEIVEKERELLAFANSQLPKLFFRQADALLIREIGKDISGTGMDSNVTGRFNNPYFHNETEITKIGILDLTEKTKGNANGVGMADFISRRCYEKIKLDQTYPNALTSTTVLTVKIPMILNTDEMVARAAVKTCNIMDFKDARLALIQNTKNMKTLYISENMADEAERAGVKILGEAREIPFDENGALELDFE